MFSTQEMKSHFKSQESEAILNNNKISSILSNELSLEMPVVESKGLVSKTNSTSIVLDNDSNESHIDLNLLIRPSQPTMQLDSSKLEDSNIDLNQNDSKSIVLLEQDLQKQNKNSINIESLSKVQSQHPMAFYAYKQKVYTLPSSKWIQKLIIIPPQRCGCHDITLVVIVFFSKLIITY